MTTYGIIGAGHIGGTIARGVIDLGHQVVIANSRGPETLAELVAELGPNARAATAAEAAAAAEIAIVSVPFFAEHLMPVEELAGKIVMDTDNYYWERDGRIAALDDGETTSAQMLQEHLPTSKVAKAFNHIFWKQILTDGTPAGTPDRRALVTSSDHPEAAAAVRDLYDALGFDTVDAGPLSESWRIERDRPAYGSRQTAAELEANLARAPRTIPAG